MGFLKDLSLGVNLIGRDISASDALKKLGRNAGATEDRFKKFGKNAARAFEGLVVAAGAAAVALGVDAVKSAIEDEKAAATLAKTLQQTTGATKEQTAAVEDYISKTQVSTGILDDELRPSLARLLRSTGDVTKAQKLQKLALDISAASGKDLGTVSNALAKANDGQLTALKKLNITIGDQAKNSADAIKAQTALNKAVDTAATAAKVYGVNSKEHQSALDKVKLKQQALNDIQAQGVDWVSELSAQYKGSLDKQLDTTAGKLALMNAKWDDAKEKMGYALLEGLQPLIDFATGPEGQKFIDDFMKEFSKGAIAVARALPGILQNMKDIGSNISALNLGKIFDPKLIAAGVAFAKYPGPWQLKLFAAVAAYAGVSVATGEAGQAFNKVAEESLGGLGAKALSAQGRARAAELSNKLKGNISNPYDMKGIDLPKFSSLYGQVPKHAKGGIFRQPTLGIIGEAGPEAVVPLGKGMGGMVVNVHVAGSVIRERDLAVSVRDNIAQMMRRRGLDPAAIGV